MGSQDHLLEAASASLCPVLCVCSVLLCDGEAGTSVGLWAAEGKAGEGGGDAGFEGGSNLGLGAPDTQLATAILNQRTGSLGGLFRVHSGINFQNVDVSKCPPPQTALLPWVSGDLGL